MNTQAIDKDELYQILHELNKFLTQEEINTILVEETTFQPGSFGIIKRNNLWFIFKHGDRGDCYYFGPFGKEHLEHLIYEICLKFNKKSYNYSIEDFVKIKRNVFRSYKEIDDYIKNHPDYA